MPRYIHHQTYEIYNVSSMEKPINNMHVYNISPIFIIDDTKLSVEFKSNILLL